MVMWVIKEYILPKILLGIIIALAVLLGIAMAGIMGQGPLAARLQTVAQTVPIYLNKTIYVNKSVPVTVLKIVNHTIYINRTIPVLINHTIYINRTIYINKSVIPPSLSWLASNLDLVEPWESCYVASIAFNNGTVWTIGAIVAHPGQGRELIHRTLRFAGGIYPSAEPGGVVYLSGGWLAANFPSGPLATQGGMIQLDIPSNSSMPPIEIFGDTGGGGPLTLLHYNASTGLVTFYPMYIGFPVNTSIPINRTYVVQFGLGYQYPMYDIWLCNWTLMSIPNPNAPAARPFLNNLTTLIPNWREAIYLNGIVYNMTGDVNNPNHYTWWWWIYRGYG
jgi:hypothetical protein